jgi:thiamine transport system permease protein
MAVDRRFVGLSAAARGAGYLLPLLAFIGLFSLLPVAVLFGTAFQSAGVGGIVQVLSDPLNQQAALNSLSQGALSAVGAVTAGVPLGILLGRYRWRGRTVVRSLLIVPFLLPSLVMVLGVESLFGPSGVLSSLWPPLGEFGSGVPGIVVVNVLFNLPLVVLLTAVGVETASPVAEETVRTLGGGPTAAFRDVWGRPALTGSVAGGLLTFVFSALSFAPPILLCGPRCYTLEARVYSLDQVLLDPTGAAILAASMVGLLLIPTALYFLLLGRLRSPVGGAAPGGRALPVRGWAAAGLIAAAALPLALVVLLIGSVLARGILPAAAGGPPGSAWTYLTGNALTSHLGVSTLGAAGNSFLFAGLAAGLALVLGTIAGATRTSRGAAVRAYRWVPLLVSPVVLSFAVASFWEPVLGGPGEVGLLILLSQATLAIPFALSGLDVALAGVPGRFRETAAALGAPRFTAYVEGELPMVRGALVTAGLFAFALCFGEFTATNFLATPSSTTLPVELYWLTEHREPGPAAALAALLVVLSLVAFLAVEGGRHRVLV